jgi:hypothetical protein
VTLSGTAYLPPEGKHDEAATPEGKHDEAATPESFPDREVRALGRGEV